MASITTRVQKSDIPTFTSKSASNSSYANVAQKNQFPKRDQGLIMDCIEGPNLTDYTCAIGDIVQPKNIIFASRISNNTVCIYLTNKDLVNEVTDKYKYVEINQQKIPIRPLVSKQQRIIFSNVSPDIPNYVFEDILDELGIKRSSPVSILKATIGKEGYNHVGSFRRQAYINPADTEKVPDMFKVNHEGINYFVYTSTDVIKCFTCNLEGHLAKNCKNAEPILNTTPTNTQLSNRDLIDTNTNKTTHLLGNQTIPSNKFNNTTAFTTPSIDDETQMDTSGTPNPNKRTHSEISSTESQNKIEIPNEEFTIVKNKNKKADKTPLQKIDDMDKKLLPLYNYLNQTDSLLNYAQFKSLMENVKGSKKPIELARQYTQDLTALKIFLKDEIHPNVRDRSIKLRCTALIKSLENPTEDITPSQTPATSDNES